MDFKNINELAKYLNKNNIAKALQTNVGKVASDKLKENIDSEVYDKYDPVVYERQRDDGGLTDDKNIEIKMIDGNTVSIESKRMDGNKNVSVVVETGVGYNEEWTFPYTHKGRPFTEVTRDEIRNDGSVEHALMKGLEAQGLKIQR